MVVAAAADLGKKRRGKERIERQRQGLIYGGVVHLVQEKREISERGPKYIFLLGCGEGSKMARAEETPFLGVK